jgi:hypothetical protein
MGLFFLSAKLVLAQYIAQLQQTIQETLLFRSLTGLEVSEFDSLYTKATSNYKEYEAKRLAREDRKRKVDSGYTFKLSLQERLLMFLVYYRLYLTYTLAGVLFDLDQSNVLKDIHKLESLVKKIILCLRNSMIKFSGCKM